MSQPETKQDLKDVSTHFSFGRNWSSYLSVVGEEHKTEAVAGLSQLITPEEISGKRFLDIGCGSGMSMLAALTLGAGEVKGVDIDPDSARTAQELLSKQASGKTWSVENRSIFDLSPEKDGTYDIVHSWGVLHHTGDMDGALNAAAALVAPGGLFVIALYRKTPLCDLWRVEKKAYTEAPAPLQAALRAVYKALYLVGLVATGRNPVTYIRDYKGNRGMNWDHDVHDWLGGYPYESVTPEEVESFMAAHGFEMVRAKTKPANIGGILGTHCDEFVARRK